ncbi:MAG: helix-turn-helix domain-containing protein [Syntrophomonadaceae bacterium]|nr:helix-turn-helix domain-containing protein [Syntrophomonadaceae bacterium]
MTSDNGKGSFPPWSRIPGLNEMCEETGVDFDSFIEDLKTNTNLNDMAAKYEVSMDTISLLQQHFMKYGLSSVMGGD